MLTLISRAVCLFVGHSPVRSGRKGHVDRIETVETHSGPGRVPVRTLAEVAHCRRCPARRVVVDLAPMSREDRRMTKWVVT